MTRERVSTGQTAHERAVKPYPRRKAAFLRIINIVTVVTVAAFSAVALGCSDQMAVASALENRGDLSGAVEIYEQVLAKTPDDTNVLSAAAVDLLLLGRYDDALSLQERIVALDRADVLTRVELGFNYLNHQERSSDAVRVLCEATLLEPSGKNLAFLAQAQIASGDGTGAEQTLRRAINIEPTYPYSYVLLAKLLQNAGREQDAEQVEEQARLHGVTVSE